MSFPRTAALICLPLLPVLFIACSASQEPKTPPPPGVACDASRADYLIGQTANGYVERQAMQASGARSARTLGPDDAATMDFDPARINVRTDPGKIVIQLACG